MTGSCIFDRYDDRIGPHFDVMESGPSLQQPTEGFPTVGVADEEAFLLGRPVVPGLHNIDPRRFSAVTLFDAGFFPIAAIHRSSEIFVLFPGSFRSRRIGQVEVAHLGQDGKGVELGKVGLGDKAQELVYLVEGTRLGLRLRL